MIKAKEIGKRIRDARLACGFRSQGALAEALRKASGGNAKLRNKISRQTVQHWEVGRVVPPWYQLGLLAAVFGDQYGEEWLMFGKRRDDQISRERPILSWISPDEQQLLSDFRHANVIGRKAIIAAAHAISAAQPIDPAEIHPLRRHTDTTEH